MLEARHDDDDDDDDDDDITLCFCNVLCFLRFVSFFNQPS